MQSENIEGKLMHELFKNEKKLHYDVSCKRNWSFCYCCKQSISVEFCSYVGWLRIWRVKTRNYFDVSKRNFEIRNVNVKHKTFNYLPSHLATNKHNGIQNKHTHLCVYAKAWTTNQSTHTRRWSVRCVRAEQKKTMKEKKDRENKKKLIYTLN